MEDKITKEKIEKYRNLSSKAYLIAKENINKDRKKEGEEILRMVNCYISDARYFEQKGDYVNAFAALNYAHGWLDTGARLGIFKVKDDKLFTIE